MQKNAFLRSCINLAVIVRKFKISKTTHLSLLLKAGAGGQDGELPTQVNPILIRGAGRPPPHTHITKL